MFGRSMGDPVANASAGLYLLVDDIKSKDAGLLLKNLGKPKGSRDSDEILVWVLASEVKGGNEKIDKIVILRQGDDAPAYLLAGVSTCRMSPGTNNQVVARLSRTDDELLIDQDQWKQSHHDLVGWLQERRRAKQCDQLLELPTDARFVVFTDFSRPPRFSDRKKEWESMQEDGVVVSELNYNSGKNHGICTVSVNSWGKKTRWELGKQTVLYDTDQACTAVMAELWQEYDAECALSMVVMIGDAMKHPEGQIEYSATRIYRARGFPNKIPSKYRRKFDKHFKILCNTTCLFSPMDARLDGRETQFIIPTRLYNQKTNETTGWEYRINPALLPTVREGRKSWLLDPAILRINTGEQEWELGFYLYLSCKWNLDAINRLVKGKPTRVRLESLLSGAKVPYKKLVKARGKPELKRRVEKTLAGLKRFCAGDGEGKKNIIGNTTIEWNSKNILDSMVCSTPPPYFDDVIYNKRSKSVESARRRHEKNQKFIEAKQ